jgi:hypothetical protein
VDATKSTAFSSERSGQGKRTVHYEVSRYWKKPFDYSKGRHLTASRSVCPGVRPHSGPVAKFNFSLKFSLDSCGLTFWWRPLWREDGSVIYCYCLASRAQSLSGECRPTKDNNLLSPIFRLPQPGGSGPRIYILQGKGGPVIPPDIGFFWIAATTSVCVQLILQIYCITK